MRERRPEADDLPDRGRAARLLLRRQPEGPLGGHGGVQGIAQEQASATVQAFGHAAERRQGRHQELRAAADERLHYAVVSIEELVDWRYSLCTEMKKNMYIIWLLSN